MAYNKARAEKEWLKWKTAEEKKLRELGVDEDTIQRLHIYDWTQFNRERRYFQRASRVDSLYRSDVGSRTRNTCKRYRIPLKQY